MSLLQKYEEFYRTYSAGRGIGMEGTISYSTGHPDVLILMTDITDWFKGTSKKPYAGFDVEALEFIHDSVIPIVGKFVGSFFIVLEENVFLQLISVIRAGGLSAVKVKFYADYLEALQQIMDSISNMNAYFEVGVMEKAVQQEESEPTDEEKDLAIAKQIAEQYGYVLAKVI